MVSKTVGVLLLSITASACAHLPPVTPESALPEQTAEVRVNQNTGEGIFYPTPAVSEVWQAVTPVGLSFFEEDRKSYVDQANVLTEAPGKSGGFSVQAVGFESETFLVTALEDGSLNTPYRARAVIARLTSIARASPTLSATGAADQFQAPDFFNLVGFKRLVISDGKDFAYEVVIKPLELQ